jgi:phosphoribosylamine--glycine ligase
VKVLLVGGGGREHAIAWKLTQDDPGLELVAAPGNPGIAALGRCVPVSATKVGALVELANAERPELVVVGPEAPLALGVADQLRACGHAVFGPSAAAARIESSKRFAKQLMVDAGVPTAEASWHADAESARRAVRERGAPVVIKASGLAAGKGVVVCGSMDEANAALDAMLLGKQLGDAGEEVLVEEFMEGEELSVFALTDGTNFATMLPSQDHKRLRERDQGPNTGGMGAYAPVSVAGPSVLEDIERRIIAPTLAAMREQGTPFQGLLYAGLMLTATGARVVEFNCRFGDPETQVVLPLLSDPLLPLLQAAAEHGGLAGVTAPAFRDGAAVTTVVASAGYPDTPHVGVRVHLGDAPAGSIIFHAGTRFDEGGRLVTSGGRVFAATAVAPTFAEAQAGSIAAARSIWFEGAYFRRDIGWRELARRARAS